ncbi:MAG: hypothetical protein AAF500_19770 [Myxococcota bacterium]
MSRRHIVFGLIVASSVLWACAGEGVPAVASGGTDPDFPSRIVVPGTGGSAGAGGSGGAGGEPSSLGACDNDSDVAALTGQNAVATATFCGGIFCISTIGDVQRHAQCVSDCIEERVVGLSTECAACYGDAAGCGLSQFCFGLCQVDTCSVGCLNCLGFAGCSDSFETCRGLPGNGCDFRRP